MPAMQYYLLRRDHPAEHQALWYEYEQVSEVDLFADSFAQQQNCRAPVTIYPGIPAKLFSRRGWPLTRNPSPPVSEWTFELIPRIRPGNRP